MLDAAQYIAEHRDEIISSRNETNEQQVAPETSNVETKEETPVETTPATVENNTETNANNSESVGTEEVTEEVTETKPVEERKSADKSDDKSDDNRKQSRKHSKQEQINYSFAKKNAKLKKLEERIKELEAENAKFKDLKLENFNNDNQQYIDYLWEQKSREQEQRNLETELYSQRAKDAEEVNNRRIEACYPDENDRKIYTQMIAEHGKDLVAKLDEADPEHAILAYLDDSDLSPILIRVLMTKPDIRNEILSKSSPYTRTLAMAKLESNVRNAQAIIARRNNNNNKKPSIPVVGSVTKSDNISNSKGVKDYNQLLHDLNNKHYY